MTHDFHKSLAESHAASDLPLWRECYARLFPNMVGMHDHRKDGDHQRCGIDRSVVLDNGKTIWIDEKIRGKNKKTGRIYTDIAVEEFSSSTLGTPGWAEKPLLCDYIAYAIGPLGKCYLLPVPQLQGAWNKNKLTWKKIFPEVRAHNLGYDTISWGIPVDVLFREMGALLRVSFDPVDI